MHWFDFTIVILFLIGFPLYGFSQRRKNQSNEDYFLGGRKTPWYIAMFSIVATETSVLTFISIPGIAYRGDWTFLQLAIGYIIGRVGVSFFLLPMYFNKGVISIYEIIGSRFGIHMQKFSSAVFLITRILADGVRFLATAIIVQVLTGWSIVFAVFVIGIATIIYSFFGGIRTILWIDSFQFILYLSGGLIAIIICLNSIELSTYETFSILFQNEKFKMINLIGNPINTPYHFISAIIGGAFLSLASHGIDHMMVQRVLSTENISYAKMAMIGSGIFVLIQFVIFLLAGALIFILINDQSIQQDREFTTFIINYVPIGLKGLLLAGALSAAMSTLSSSINSLTTSTVVDWIGKNSSLQNSKMISLFWGIVLVLFAIIFDERDSSLVEVGLRIASFTYGGLLGLFFLSKLNREFNILLPPIGMIASLLIVFLLDSYGLAWTWFILISSVASITIVMLLQYIVESIASIKA